MFTETIKKIVDLIPLHSQKIEALKFESAGKNECFKIDDKKYLNNYFSNTNCDKLYFILGDGTPNDEKKDENELMHPIYDVLEKKSVDDYDLVIAVERIELNTNPNNRTSLSFSDVKPQLCKYIDQGADSLYKIDEFINPKDQSEKYNHNKFTALFIKIPICQGNPDNSPNIVEVDGVWYDITNLLTYLEIADSRTYKNVVYRTPIYRADAAERVPDVEVDWAQNMLVHGAPGTGKSFTVNKKAEKSFGKNLRRVTFYEDYSYEKFVGAYMPVQDIKTTNLSFDDKMGYAKGEGIAYKFKPGVMANILAEAFAELIIAQNKNYYAKHKNDEILSLDELYKIEDGEVKPQKFCLIIEEINRAPAASVFGDFFQLLDREDNGLSTYSICVSDEFKEWFVDRVEQLCEAHYDDSTDAYIFEINKNTAKLVADNLKLPPNLYIWATMNSADQGVFPLDTAFKRRWGYLYMSVDTNRKGTKEEPKRNIKIPYMGKITDVDWDAFRNAINAAIQAAGCIEEDRLIGTWYFNDNDFAANDKLFEKDVNERYSMINPLCDKLFAYLRNDVFRNNPESFFNKDYSTMGKIREAIINGESLGLDKIIKNFSIKPSDDSAAPQTDSQATSEPEE